MLLRSNQQLSINDKLSTYLLKYSKCLQWWLIHNTIILTNNCIIDKVDSNSVKIILTVVFRNSFSNEIHSELYRRYRFRNVCSREVLKKIHSEQSVSKYEVWQSNFHDYSLPQPTELSNLLETLPREERYSIYKS